MGNLNCACNATQDPGGPEEVETPLKVETPPTPPEPALKPALKPDGPGPDGPGPEEEEEKPSKKIIVVDSFCKMEGVIEVTQKPKPDAAQESLETGLERMFPCGSRKPSSLFRMNGQEIKLGVEPADLYDQVENGETFEVRFSSVSVSL